MSAGQDDLLPDYECPRCGSSTPSTCPPTPRPSIVPLPAASQRTDSGTPDLRAWAANYTGAGHLLTILLGCPLLPFQFLGRVVGIPGFAELETWRTGVSFLPWPWVSTAFSAPPAPRPTWGQQRWHPGTPQGQPGRRPGGDPLAPPLRANFLAGFFFPLTLRRLPGLARQDPPGPGGSILPQGSMPRLALPWPFASPHQPSALCARLPGECLAGGPPLCRGQPPLAEPGGEAGRLRQLDRGPGQRRPSAGVRGAPGRAGGTGRRPGPSPHPDCWPGWKSAIAEQGRYSEDLIALMGKTEAILANPPRLLTASLAEGNVRAELGEGKVTPLGAHRLRRVGSRR
jgi:hypothetical protein